MRIAIFVIMALAASMSAADGLDRGEKLFGLHCATCHGETARGGGPMSAVLAVAPPDLTLLARHNGGVFPHAQAARRIDGRELVVAHGGAMPVFGWFFDGPKVPLKGAGEAETTASQVAAIVAWLEKIQRP